MKTPGQKIVDWFIASKYEGNVFNGASSDNKPNTAIAALVRRIDKAIANHTVRATPEARPKVAKKQPTEYGGPSYMKKAFDGQCDDLVNDGRHGVRLSRRCINKATFSDGKRQLCGVHARNKPNAIPITKQQPTKGAKKK